MDRFLNFAAGKVKILLDVIIKNSLSHYTNMENSHRRSGSSILEAIFKTILGSPSKTGSVVLVFVVVVFARLYSVIFCVIHIQKTWKTR